MASATAFIRHTPKVLLRAYLDQVGIDPPFVDWEKPEAETASMLISSVGQMDEPGRSRFVRDAERVCALADEAGQTALCSVASCREKLDSLASGHARALWMFLHDPSGFRHAEEVRFTDERRRGRMWDGFVGPMGREVSRDASALEALKAEVRTCFESPNVQLDLFDRHRPRFGEDDIALVQLTVYSEGRLDGSLELVDGVLDRRSRRSVIEAAVTYEPASGAIEVVVEKRGRREQLARLFLGHLLAAPFSQDRLPLRRYDLHALMRPSDFPTDLDDRIEAVRVTSLRLMPIETAGERVTLECMRKSPYSIWDMAQQRFGLGNPLLGGWVPTQAKLTIRFHPEPGARRRRVLPLTVTVPHGCDLKDRTERERVVGTKYLQSWGIVRDV